jgi:hypothetical protein
MSDQAAKELKNEIATAVAEVWAECAKIADAKADSWRRNCQDLPRESKVRYHWEGAVCSAVEIAFCIRSRSAQPFTSPAPKLPAKVEGWFAKQPEWPLNNPHNPVERAAWKMTCEEDSKSTRRDVENLRPLCLAVAEAAREEEQNSSTVPTIWLNHHDKRVAEEERKRIVTALRKQADSPYIGDVTAEARLFVAGLIESDNV